MRIARACVLGLVLSPALAACSGPGAAPHSAAAKVEPRGAAPTGRTEPEAVPVIAPLPEALVLSAEILPSGVELVIQNRGSKPVELALAASVERVASERSAGASSETLRLDCAEAAPSCLSLVPGAELRAPAWPASQPRAQCGAGARGGAKPGDYRFGVRPCGQADGAPVATSGRVSAPFAVR